MKRFFCSLMLSSFFIFDLLQSASAFPIPMDNTSGKCSSDGKNGYFKLSSKKKRGSSFQTAKAGNEPRLLKRSDNIIEYELQNQDTFYSVEMVIGSEGQIVNLLIDTGSSDMWVVGSDNQWCKAVTSSAKMIVSDDFIKSSNKKRLTPNMDLSVSDELNKRDPHFIPEPNFQDGNNNKNTENLSDVDLVTDSLIGHGAAIVTVTATSTAVNVRTTTVVVEAYSTASSSKSSSATYDCAKFGTFDTRSSNSWKSNNTDFSITYMDGTYAKGTWGQDEVLVNGITISNMNFATSNDASSEMGVLGIGYQYLESTYTYSNGNEALLYENLPMKLKSEGYINKLTYSIYLNDSDSNTANVLFGGIDHDKYTGNLTSLSVINPDGNSRPDRVMVTLNSLSLSSSSNKSTIGTGTGQAVLDTGTTLSYFPTAILNSLIVKLNSEVSIIQSNGYFMMRCSEASNYYLDFNFQGYEVRTPLKSFLLNVDELSDVKAESKSSSYCAIGILETDSYFLLGDVFLRNIYLIVDLEDDIVAIAPANKASNTENIEAINGPIPSVTAAATFEVWTKGFTFTPVSS